MEKKSQPTKKQNPHPKDQKKRDFTAEQKRKIIQQSNPTIDNNIIRGYN